MTTRSTACEALLCAIALTACESAQPSSPPPDATPDVLVSDRPAVTDATVTDASATDAAVTDASATDAGATGMVVTTGLGQRSASCLAAATCMPGAIMAGRETTCGSITQGGMTFALPAPLTEGEAAVDVYSVCSGSGDMPDYASRLTTRVIDPDGAVVTGTLFSDNYFELFVNGRFVARDALGFTPFNTAAVRFQARYPMTLAVSLVDWEGYLGIGLESRGGAYHIGDGGFIAVFSNGVTTGAQWRCRPYYVAPLDDPGCITLGADGAMDSARCPSTDTAVRCVTNDPEHTCRGAHQQVPTEWAMPGYDDRRWPSAALFDAARVTADPAYTRYASGLLGTGRFIWSSNLDLDNHVLCRITVAAP